MQLQTGHNSERQCKQTRGPPCMTTHYDPPPQRPAGGARASPHSKPPRAVSAWWTTANIRFFVPTSNSELIRESPVWSPKQSHKMPAAGWPASSFLTPATPRKSQAEPSLRFSPQSFPLQISACLKLHQTQVMVAAVTASPGEQPVCAPVLLVFISTTQMLNSIRGK